MLRLIVKTKKMKKRVLALVMEQSSSESSDALSIELSVSMQRELMKQNKKLTRTLSETLKRLNVVQRDNETVHEYCEQLENELAYKTIMLASFERHEKEEQEKKEEKEKNLFNSVRTVSGDWRPLPSSIHARMRSVSRARTSVKTDKEHVCVKRRKTQLDKLLEQNQRFNRWHK